MNVVPGVRRTASSAGRVGRSIPRSAGRRWLARAGGGVFLAGASWIVYCAAGAFFDRGKIAVPAKRADLTISISGDAMVESRSNLVIQSRVRGWYSILEIVPDGGIVRKGDVLVRLDSTLLEEAIQAEKVLLGKAQAALTRATKECQAAKIAIDEYREGTYVEQRLRLTQRILVAQQRLASTERSLLQNEIMFRRGFASKAHVDAMQLAVDKERTDLAAAKTKKEVLEEFTLAKMLGELTAKRDAAQARMKSEEVVVRRHAAKIKRLEDDLANCVIRAPRDGMAVCADWAVRPLDGTNQQAVGIYPGATVRQHQMLMHLADVSQMQLIMLIPENKVARLRRGLRAHAMLLDHKLEGEVASIAEKPEMAPLPGDGAKRFAVVIAIDGRGGGLKPGMTAEVEIVVAQKKNTLIIPALCVIEEGGKPRVRVKTWSGVESRQVLLGIGDDTLVEVIDGVKESELVLLGA